MRITVNPLVVAAALGLLGPAALAEDDELESNGIAGVWQRTGASAPSSALHSGSLSLGDRIEMIPFEGRVLLDDGSAGHQGEWSQDVDGMHRQELVLDGKTVSRSFQADGDQLAVRTIVLGEHGAETWLDTFQRQD